MSTRDRIERRLSNPDQERTRAIQSLEWASHNIPLGGGISTISDPELPLIGDDPRTVLISRLLRETGRLKEPGRLLDLGALEGGLSFEMARLGHQVLCVEGRRENADKCRLVVEYFQIEDSMEVLEEDVRSLNEESHGTFNIILCCGLLYHLDQPFEFLHLLSSLLRPGGILFIDTHVAPQRDDEVEASAYANALSKLQPLDAAHPQLEGRWIQEHDPGHNGTHPWASIGNPRSFWATKESLFLTLEAAGFSTFFEAFGAFPLEREFELKKHHSRVYLVATKQP